MSVKSLSRRTISLISICRVFLATLLLQLLLQLAQQSNDLHICHSLGKAGGAAGGADLGGVDLCGKAQAAQRLVGRAQCGCDIGDHEHFGIPTQAALQQPRQLAVPVGNMRLPAAQRRDHITCTPAPTLLSTGPPNLQPKRNPSLASTICGISATSVQYRSSGSCCKCVCVDEFAHCWAEVRGCDR